MADITLTLTPGEADQTLRALAGRKRAFRNSLVAAGVFDDLLSAQQKILNQIQVGVDAPVQEPVASTPAPRKRRTAKKED